jgi:hypothetical protein
MAGPDLDGVVTELEAFVELSTPVSRDGGFAHYTSPRQILSKTALVDPLLDRFYPEWRTECGVSRYDEYSQRREAAIRCVAKIRTRDQLGELLGDVGPELQATKLHRWVWDAARPQWDSGHFGEAVGAAARNVNSQLQSKVDRRDLSDSKLVRDTFSTKPATDGHPRLRLAPPDQSEGYTSLQEGAGHFGAGCYQAIRNPVAHDPQVAPGMEEQLALEQLAAFSILARWIESAELETV